MSSTTKKPRIVYYQHAENGAVHGYDEAFLAGAFASLDMPPHEKAMQKKKHPLEEIAIQVRRRILQPCKAPAVVATVQVPDEQVQQVLAKERELGRERKRVQLEDALARLAAGEDVQIPEHLLGDGEYTPAAPAVLVPDAAEREPGAPRGITEGGGAPAPVGRGDDVPFDDLPPIAPMDVDGGAVVAGGSPSTKPRASRARGR